MILIRENVEKIADGAKAEKLIAEGFVVVSDESVTDENNAVSGKMTVDELKALASEKGIDIEGMKKADIIEALKDVM